MKKSLRSFTDYKQRSLFLEDEFSVSLSSIRNQLQENTELIHCENLIGATSVPVGVVGPLKVNGDTLQNAIYVPLATTEGALVASTNRGCKAITESGGVVTKIEFVGATRGPVFKAGNLQKAHEFTTWLEENWSELQTEATSTSNHLKLIDKEYAILGNNIFVRFIFDTDQAMGMNMVTLATQQIVRYIQDQTDVECISVAGNFDVDKKPAYLNFLRGRGRKGWAEVVIPSQVVVSVLKTTPEQFVEVVQKKCMQGSIMSGATSFNSHFANLVAAFFVSTGQDLGHIGECSVGVTTAEVQDGDLYVSIYMPDIMMAVVGGGTKLQSQTEARKLMGVQTVDELTEALLGVVLAGEISLLASLAEGTLAKAHKTLGR